MSKMEEVFNECFVTQWSNSREAIKISITAQASSSFSLINFVTILNCNVNFWKGVTFNNLPPWDISKKNSHSREALGNKCCLQYVIKIWRQVFGEWGGFCVFLGFWSKSRIINSKRYMTNTTENQEWRYILKSTGLVIFLTCFYIYIENRRVLYWKITIFLPKLRSYFWRDVKSVSSFSF